MTHAGIRCLSGIAVGAAIATAYLQVASAPAVPAVAVPSRDQVVSHVASELAWMRTEIPRNRDYWTGVARQSSGNLRGLVDALTVAGGHSAR